MSDALMARPATEPEWKSSYGPRQLCDLLGLAEWQRIRARQSGVIPAPAAAGGRWSREQARALYPRQVAIRRHVGYLPDLGETRAAEYLSERLGITVEPHALPELARQGRILVVDGYKDRPLYCGRTLETWVGTDDVEVANIRGELLITDRVVDRLGVRHADVKQLVEHGWLRPVEWGRGLLTAKKYAADVPLYRAGDITDLLRNEEIDWDAVRAVPKGGRSLLSKLPHRPAATS